MRRMMSALRDRDVAPTMAGDQDVEQFGLRYPSRATARAARNAEYRGMFHIYRPVEGTARWQILERCLIDTESEPWLSHIKLIHTTWWRQLADGHIAPHPVAASVYMGSHNASELAWLRGNFECGVLLPIRASPRAAGIAIPMPTGGRPYHPAEAIDGS